MFKVRSSKGFVVHALAMSSVLVACDVDSQAGKAEQPVVVAQAAPMDTAEPVTVVSNTETTKSTVVTYEDAEAIFRKGRYAEAAELFKVFVSTHPENGFGHYMLGLSAWKSGDRGKAVEALTRAVELDSASVKARTNLGRVLLEQGQADAALPHLKVAVELAPDAHEVWRVLGNVHSELGSSDSAIASYRQALIRNPKDTWSMNNYGLVLIKLGRYEDALRPLARAVELNPRSPVFQNNLGVAYERSGWLGGARSAFNAAIEADATYVKAKISLERVQQRLGEGTDESPEITALAKSFVDEMERWRTEGSTEVVVR